MSTNVTFGAGPFIDGNEYQGSDGKNYIFQAGCFLCPRPEDVDTVDGYPDFGVSDGTIVDAITGDPIPAGAPVIIAYDADGVPKYKDCTDQDTDTLGVPSIAEDSGTALNGDYSEGQTIIDFNGVVVCVPEKDDEIGPAITVDLGDDLTWPTDSGDYDKQCLVDADGNMVGFVDSTGSHFIEDTDDEVGPNIEIDPDDQASWPTEPVAPHDLQFLCDADGVVCGLVVASGSKPLPKPVLRGFSQTSVAAAGDVDGQGNIIAYIDQYGNPIPDGTSAHHDFDADGNYIGSYCGGEVHRVRKLDPGPSCAKSLGLEIEYKDGTTQVTEEAVRPLCQLVNSGAGETFVIDNTVPDGTAFLLGSADIEICCPQSQYAIAGYYQIAAAGGGLGFGGDFDLPTAQSYGGNIGFSTNGGNSINPITSNDTHQDWRVNTDETYSGLQCIQRSADQTLDFYYIAQTPSNLPAGFAVVVNQIGFTVTGAELCCLTNETEG